MKTSCNTLVICLSTHVYIWGLVTLIGTTEYRDLLPSDWNSIHEDFNGASMDISLLHRLFTCCVEIGRIRGILWFLLVGFDWLLMVEHALIFISWTSNQASTHKTLTSRSRSREKRENRERETQRDRDRERERERERETTYPLMTANSGRHSFAASITMSLTPLCFFGSHTSLSSLHIW